MMKKPDLRVYRDSTDSDPAVAEATVKMKLRDLFPLLAQAHRHNYLWLKDLADDEVRVTRDLAQVLESFAEIVNRRKGA